MIKVRIETQDGNVVEQPIDLPTLEKWIEDGILTADDEVWSDILTGGVWKKIGDLTLFKKITLKKQSVNSLAMEDLISRGSLEQHQKENMLTQQEIKNRLVSAKTLGGIGQILLLISGIVILLPLIGYWTYFLFSIVGLILFVIAMKYISDAVNDSSIFHNTLIYVFGPILVTIISFVIGFGVITSVMRGGLFDLLKGAVSGIALLIILMYIGMIIMIYYLRKALVTTAQRLNISLFKVGGDLYLWGWITTLILIGFIIMLIGEIILMVAFFSIREDISLEMEAASSFQPKVKYCPNCGSRLSFSDRFCSNCGEKQEEY